MISRQEALTRLQQLQRQIPFLQTKTPFGRNFQRWHREVISVLDDYFGPGSSEKIEFQRISFKVEPELLRKAQEQILKVFPGKRRSTLNMGFQISKKDYFRKRLYEAAELLLAMEIRLKAGK
jgi:hypothetical protein